MKGVWAGCLAAQVHARRAWILVDRDFEPFDTTTPDLRAVAEFFGFKLTP